MQDQCERCSLVARAPRAFSHAGAECGWPDLATTCPDCGRDGEACSFFSDNAEGNGCRGLSRLVTLCLRCQLDGLQRRVDSQLRQRVIILSGGEGSQRAVSFATGHFRAYKDSLKRVAGVWLPQDIATPETEFFWDRSSIPWRFSLVPRPSAETVTMRGLHSALGMDGEAESGADALDVPDGDACGPAAGTDGGGAYARRRAWRIRSLSGDRGQLYVGHCGQQRAGRSCSSSRGASSRARRWASTSSRCRLEPKPNL